LQAVREIIAPNGLISDSREDNKRLSAAGSVAAVQLVGKNRNPKQALSAFHDRCGAKSV
jgi:hypothetical protein